MKNVLIVVSGPRRGGNSEQLADEFLRGAAENGHRVEKIGLQDKQIGFCRGCLSCQRTKRCVIVDDASEIIEKIALAEVLAFATPIYFYEMCGQMKTLLDRSNPLFPRPYAFRDVYLLAAAADPELAAIDGAVQGLKGWIRCFSRSRLSGVVRGVDVTDVGDIRRFPERLEAAYQMGKTV